MKVCSECFEDTDIKQRIRSINKKGTCDIHNEINYIYDTDLDEGLKDDFEILYSIYKKDEDGKYKDSSNLKNTYTSLKEDWNIFSFKPKPEDIRKFLSSLLEKPLPKNVNTIIPELESEEEISKQSMLGNHTWEDFCEHIKYDNRFYNDYFSQDIFLTFLKWTQVSIKEGTVLYRSRIYDGMGKYQSKDMKMSPKNLVHPGRLNSDGIGVLYTSSSRDITVNEIRPDVGDKVATAELTVKRDLNIADLTKLDNIPVFGSDVDSEFLVKYQINRDILNSISSQMEEPSGSQCNNLDYLPTQYISDFIKLEYEGIKYGSTLISKEDPDYNQDYNLALLIDKDFEFNNISYKRIKSRKYAYYD